MSGMSYIGRTATRTKNHYANEVVCAVVDDPKNPTLAADAVAEWIKEGLTIERVPVEWVRKHFMTTDKYEPTP